MLHLRIIPTIVFLLFTSISIGSPGLPIQAQQDCGAIVQTSLVNALDACADVGPGEACYGSGDLTATTFGGTQLPAFSSPGDIIPLDGVRTLRSSALDSTAGQMGVVVLNLPFSLPEESNQASLVLVMGDVVLENLVDPAAIAQIEFLADPPTSLVATAPAEAGVYGFPMAMGLPPDATISEGTVITVDGRTSDNRWLRFYLDGGVAWVQVADIALDGDLEQLDVVSAISFDVPLPGEPGLVPRITPLQAFDFQSGSQWCGDMPVDGLLVRTATYPGRTWMLVNDIALTARSATFIMQTNLSLQVLTGSVQVSAADGGQLVAQGQQTSVPVNADGRAAGPPSTPTRATTTTQALADMDLPLASLVDDDLYELELVPLVDENDTLGLPLVPIVIENTRWVTHGEVAVDGWTLGWSAPFIVDDQLRIVSADGMAYLTYAGPCVQVFDTWTMRVAGLVVDRHFELLYLDRGGRSENMRWLPCDLPALLQEAAIQAQAVFRALDLLVTVFARMEELRLPVADRATARVDAAGAYVLYEVYRDPAPAEARRYGEGEPTPPDILQMLDQEHRNDVIRQFVSMLLQVVRSM